MHLMSFYASPYRTTNDKSVNNMSSKKRLSTLIWFVAGALLGCLVAFYFTKQVRQNPAPEGDKIAQLLEQHAAGAVANPIISSPDAVAAPLAVTPADAATKPVPTWPLQVEVHIAAGDTLIDILIRQGVDAIAAHRLAKQVNGIYNLRRLRPGHALSMSLVEDKLRTPQADFTPTKLSEMQLFISELETLQVKAKGSEEYDVQIVKKKLISEPVRTKSIIVGSFYKTLQHRGMPKESINGLIKNFSYEIDFQRDIKAGDLIDVMYETKRTESGKVVASGDVIYAMLKSDGKVIKHYRYTDPYGVERFYNDKGESIVKRLLKTPIDGARISSGFGMRRHPIMGYSKMHQGVDFAASTGTPIYASGDGIVQFAGYRGGYGNIVELKHNGMYVTAYAHASRIHPLMRRGARVRQGQVIAYVGSTGNSTGAHLHYEIRRYGRQINPLGVQLAGSSDQLQGRQLVAFEEHMRKVHQQLASVKTNGEEKVAMAQ